MSQWVGIVLVVVVYIGLLIALGVANRRLARLEAKSAAQEQTYARLARQHATLQALYAARTRELLAINSGIVLESHRARRNTQ